MHPGNDLTVLVVGDVMLDVYVTGEAWRISPEAPVPVVAVKSRSHTLGGAGNVALNLRGLQRQSWLFGAVNEDYAGNEIVKLLSEHDIGNGLVVDRSLPTTTKTRVIANNQQLVRFDEEGKFNGNRGDYTDLTMGIIRVLSDNHVGAVILSDYNKGVLSQDLVSRVIAFCRASDIPVLVDPKRGDWKIYRNATVVKPNLSELREATGYGLISTHDEVSAVARMMLRDHQLQAVLVTMGERGMVLVTDDKSEFIPTRAKEVFDVSGAGDTVIATLAAYLCSGYSLSDAARIANLAAGIVVGKVGTSPVTIEELFDG